MRSLRAFVIPAAAVLSFAAATPAALQAQIDLTGTWMLELTVLLDGEGEPCRYSGTVVASQDEASWTGPAELVLVSGPAECPAEMIGDLTGSLNEDGGVIFITGFVDGGDPSGVATFDGTISPNPGGTGTMIVTQGPFVETEGEWIAILQQSVLEIPGLTPVGLTLLTLLLLAGGAWLLARRA